MGHSSRFSIDGYCKYYTIPADLVREYNDWGVIICELFQVNKETVLDMMLAEALFLALDHFQYVPMKGDEPVNSELEPVRILLISKYIEGNSNLSLVSTTLGNLGCLVAWAHPDSLIDCQREIPQTEMEQEPQSSVKFSDPMEEETLNLMYSIQPLVQYKEENICVFWDLDDYPVHDSLSLHQDLEEDLRGQAYSGNLSFHYFASSGNDFLAQFYPNVEQHNLTITILPEGGTRDKYYAMMTHILLWALGNRPPSNIIVLSRNVEDETYAGFQSLYSDGYGIYLTERKSRWCIVPEESSAELFPSLISPSARKQSPKCYT